MSFYYWGGFPEITQDDWKVFAEYGRTMLAVQSFEFFLMKVVDEQIEEYSPTEATSIEDLYRRIDKLFRLTAGQLKETLKRETEIPEDVLTEVEAVVRHRNHLAHEFLSFYREDRRFYEAQQRFTNDPEFRDPHLSDERNEFLRQLANKPGPSKTPYEVSSEGIEELRKHRERFEMAEDRLHAWAH